MIKCRFSYEIFSAALDDMLNFLRLVFGEMQHLFADVNECATSLSNPCQNSGTCLNKQGGFTCQCPSNWTGSLCNQGQWIGFLIELLVSEFQCFKRVDKRFIYVARQCSL